MNLQKRVVLLETLSKPVYYLILCIALAVYWRGHNEPGGGFIGGLIAASSNVFWASVFGMQAAKKRLPLGSPMVLVAWGALLAGVSGLPGLLTGHSYLYHLWWELPLGFTTLPLSTVQLFDLGIFMCVWGGIGGYAIELMDLGNTQSAANQAPSTQGERI